jgi:mxaK protein
MGTLNRQHWLPGLGWILLLACLGVALWNGAAWYADARVNRQIAELDVATGLPEHADPRLHYAAGWQLERADRLEPALAHYARAELAEDPQQRARAKLALGNVQLHIGLIAGDIGAGGSHVRSLAHLQLAREAYRSALRLDPDLRAARYNLELLERLSPGRRVQGWSRREENVHLQPEDERQGWAAMKEGNAIRGLP